MQNMQFHIFQTPFRARRLLKPLLLAVTLLFCYSLYALDENEIYCYIKKIGIKHPEIVLKQAIYESGHFTSKIFKNKNNLFGFRHTMTYMSFDNWQASVDYYKVWQDKYYKNDTEDYYKFLQRKNYSGYKEFNYSAQLKRIKIRASLNCFEDDDEEE